MTIESGSIERRYFWRRAIGFILDLVLALLLSALVLWAVHRTTGIDLGAPGIVHVTQCGPAPADHPQVQRIDRAWPLNDLAG